MKKAGALLVLVGILVLSLASAAGAWSGDTSLTGTATCAGTVTWTVHLTSSGANPATPPHVLTSTDSSVIPVGSVLTNGEQFVEDGATLPASITITVNYPEKGGDTTPYSASATASAPEYCPPPTTTTLPPSTTTAPPSTTSTTLPATTT